MLEHDPSTDELVALGTVGAEQFDAFFQKYDVKLQFEYGPGKAKRPIGEQCGRARADELLQDDDPVLSRTGTGIATMAGREIATDP